VGHFLVYMNGIEVPVEAVSVSYGVWQIPEASITMAPDPVLQRVGAEDRIQISVWFCDDFLRESTGDVAKFRLLFEGEIVGWGYQVTPSGRSVTFSAVNQIAIFTQLFVHFLMNTDDMAAHGVDITQGVTDLAPVHSELVWPFSLFKQGLTGTDQITHPFEFMFNLVKNMCGASPTVPDEQRSVPAANFFTRWARLTNFVNRFVATPVFDEGTGANTIFPALEAMQQTAALDVLTQSLIRQIQNSGSIWEMLQLVYQTMFMEIAMIPTAPLVTVDLKTGAVLPTSFKSRTVVPGANPADGQSNSDLSGSVASAAPPDPLKPNRLLNYFAKPQFLFGVAPACNVMFPSQIEMWNYDENYATQPTRLYFNDEVVNRLLKPNGVLADAVMNALATAYPPEADILNKARLTGAKNNGKNFLLWPEEFFKGPVLDRRPLPNWFFILKQIEQSGKPAANDTTGTDASPGSTNPLQGVDSPTPSVYQLYAEYEFYRERYSRRAGAVVLKFNPFILPGFPAVIFDNRASRMDLFCYVMNVRHDLSSRGIRTNVTYSYARTAQEMLALMAQLFDKGQLSSAAAPREPIKAVRDVIQHFKSADDFYRALLYGRSEELADKVAGFDWRLAVGYMTKTDYVEPIVVDGVNDTQVDTYNTALASYNKYTVDIAALQDANTVPMAEVSSLNTQIAAIPTTGRTAWDDAKLIDLRAQVALQQAQMDANNTRLAAYKTDQAVLKQQLDASKVPAKAVVHNIDPARELAPLPAFEDMFTYYDAAMKFNWRPICSLDDYLVFYQSTGEGAVPAFGTTQSVGALYYERIRTMVPLTDEKEPSGVDGLPPVLSQAGGNGGVAAPVGLPAGFAQTRKNWDEALLAYRNNVYISKVPRG